MRTKRNSCGDTVCSALQGRLGERVRCTIYGLRPRACSAFRLGGPDCRSVRRKLGFEC